MKIIQDNNIPKYDDWVDINNQPIAEPDFHYYNRIRRIENDSYAPSAGEVVIAGMDNWIRICKVFAKDYIYKQNRINEEFQKKAGGDNTTKWGNCSDEEKDFIIYYNQMKDEGSDVENALKRAHLIATNPNINTESEAAAYLKTNQSESAERAKVAIHPRAYGAKLTNYIIDFLNPTDQMTLFNKVNPLLTAYSSFVLVGTVIPGDPDGLWDYINGTYLGGLVNEPFTTINGRPLTDLRDLLNDLLFGDNKMTL